MSDKLTERKFMSASAEASTLLRQIAGKGEPGEYKKEAWARAYRRLAGQWTFNRVKDLWRQEPRAKVSAEELNQLRAAAKVTAGADSDVLARLESVEQMLRALASRLPQDADFYGAQADQLRDAARDVGRKSHT
jgi:hypothetical protein